MPDVELVDSKMEWYDLKFSDEVLKRFKPKTKGHGQHKGKRATTRLEQKCNPGDRFVANGDLYQVTHIIYGPAKLIIKANWDAEGYVSEGQFRKELEKFYKFDDETTLYCHFFKKRVPYTEDRKIIKIRWKDGEPIVNWDHLGVCTEDDVKLINDLIQRKFGKKWRPPRK